MKHDQQEQRWPWVCSGVGLVCFLTALFSCGNLQRGSWYSSVAVAVLLVFWIGLGAVLLWRAKLEKSLFLACLFPLALALLVRVLCLDHVTYDYLDFLSPWTEFFRQYGGFSALRHPVGNYNVPYLYFLAAISYLPLPDLYLIKLFSIFFDLLLAYGGLHLARKITGKAHCGVAVFCLLLCLPTVVLNGAYWGQCDSIYAALSLLALADVLEEKPGRSVVLLSLAFSFKLQTIFLIPLWCVFWFASRVKFRHLLLFPVTYFVTCVPALLLGKPMIDILGVYFNQTKDYAALTLNAPSIFALIPYNAVVNEELWGKIGVLAAFLLLAAELIWLFVKRNHLDADTLVMAGLLMSLFIPLFLPHMHERYFILADVLSVAFAAKSWKRCALPVAVQIASYGGYHAYLVLRYAFPMAWGTWLLLASTLAVTGILAHSLHVKKAETR